MLRIPLAAVLLLTATAASAQMQPPQIVAATVDWGAARADLTKSPLLQDAAAYDLGADDSALARLNAATSAVFPRISNSAVPVLVPFSLAADRGDNATAAQSGFRATFFYAGPTGYDAAFTLPSELASGISGRAKRDEITVQISAFSVLYQLEPQRALDARPVKELEANFPGIRRLWHESNLRYAFTRYGVTYVASMLCVDGPPRGRRVACRDADRVIVQFLNALQLAGGTPQPMPAAASTIERPAAVSPDFAYMSPGHLLPNTGFHRYGGRADRTVYAKIRFPLAQAPAYANSQSFLNWGNCDFTGRTSATSRKGGVYRCRVNDKPLVFDESTPENRSYPWRDNFCEHRFFFVGQCPGGQGHQGQDIRPANCRLRNEGADRCTPFLDDVVAVRDGAIMRTAGRESMYLIANAPGERVRVRYLHMSPKRLDADGMLSGRLVHEGEVLGKVGNFDRHENGTTYHLHFDMQVPAEFGWVLVNPYMTLVASYERLIGGQGREIVDDNIMVVAPPDTGTVDTPEPDQDRNGATTPAASDEDTRPAGQTGSVNTAVRIAPATHAMQAEP